MIRQLMLNILLNVHQWNKSRIESEKVSPHQFQNWLTSESPSNASYHSNGDRASENFSQVQEDEIESLKYVPQEPPKRVIYSGIVKSPNMLSDDTSKKTFDYSKTKDDILQFNDDHKICKTHENFKMPRKYKDFNLNHKSTVNNRLSNTFKNISKNWIKDKAKAKQRTSKEKHKFNYIGAAKLRFRHLSSVTSSTFNQIPKSNISFKSRNRDSSVGSGDFRPIIKSIQIDPETTRNKHILAKYKIINKGFLTQRNNSKNSPNSPNILGNAYNKMKKVNREEHKENKIYTKPKKQSKSQRRNDSKSSRDHSIGQRTSNVLYGLKNKLKSSRELRESKSRAHSSSEFRAFVHTFKTDRSTFNHPIRSISNNRHDLKSSFKHAMIKHKRNSKIISSSNSTISISKLNKNPSFITVGIVPKTITHIVTPKQEAYKGKQFSKKHKSKQIKSHINLPRF